MYKINILHKDTLTFLETVIMPEGGGGTNIFSPHFKMAAAKVNSSFLKDILKLTASRVLKLGEWGELKKQLLTNILGLI